MAAQPDLKSDITPKHPFVVAGPTLSALETALSAYNSTSYSTARLAAMTKRDKIYAAKLHGLTVAGL